LGHTIAGSASGKLHRAAYPFLIPFFAHPCPANAQRVQDNAVTTANDAFGTSVGNQSIGLYSPSSARGFSPADAANIRIEGLYFDQEAGIDPYLFSGTTMRVGIAAQSYVFPSPSGIADLTLRTPASGNGASLVIIRGPLGKSSVEIDTRIRANESLSAGLNLGQVRDFDYLSTPFANRRGISLLMHYQPRPGTEVFPFFGFLSNSEKQFVPGVYADRINPLPVFDVTRLPAQSWTKAEGNQLIAGVIMKAPISESWNIRGGVFRSAANNGRSASDLLLGLRPDGTANHVAVISPDASSASYSGDLRVVRSRSSKSHEGTLTLAARFRDVKRIYGGDAVIDLGPASIYQDANIAEPPSSFSSQNRDGVRQTGVGVDYSEIWEEHGSISVGLQMAAYHRTLESSDKPSTAERIIRTLPTASFTASLSKVALIYGSYTRGLEDSPGAPATAQNRGEPPPATSTSQIDAGIRITMDPHLSLVAGVFKVNKSYFNLDTSSRYTNLGDISSRGVEASATWAGPEGFTAVVGACWLRPEVTRKFSELGGSGSIPVGPIPRVINVNVDYAPSFWRGWGISLQWTSLSSRVATANDDHLLAPFATWNLTARYDFSILKQRYAARLEVDNVTNTTGLTLSTAFAAFSQPRRNYMLTLTADL